MWPKIVENDILYLKPYLISSVSDFEILLDLVDLVPFTWNEIFLFDLAVEDVFEWVGEAGFPKDSSVIKISSCVFLEVPK